jgi:organic radical activating enzyme
MGVDKPNTDKIIDTIIENADGVDDVLFLGGEPCLYLDDLLKCVKALKHRTNLKLFVTTAVPKVCFDRRDLFSELIGLLDGLNLSVQHHDETIADEIRNTVSYYDRQKFYDSLPHKEKIRINLNIVKPHLHTLSQLTQCLFHYDKMGFNSIKLSEIQHGKEYYTSFEEVFDLDLGSPYVNGCQNYIDAEAMFGITTPVLLKRSCFLCEDTLNASLKDGLKVLSKIFTKPNNKYGVVYGNGDITNGWV